MRKMAKMTTRNTQKLAPFEQLNQNNENAGKNGAVIGNSIVLAYS